MSMNRIMSVRVNLPRLYLFFKYFLFLFHLTEPVCTQWLIEPNERARISLDFPSSFTYHSVRERDERLRIAIWYISSRATRGRGVGSQRDEAASGDLLHEIKYWREGVWRILYRYILYIYTLREDPRGPTHTFPLTSQL